MGNEQSLPAMCLKDIMALYDNSYNNWEGVMERWNQAVPFTTSVPDDVQLPLCHDKKVWDVLLHLLDTYQHDLSSPTRVLSLLAATSRLLSVKGLYKIYNADEGMMRCALGVFNSWLEAKWGTDVASQCLRCFQVCISRSFFQHTAKYDRYERLHRHQFVTLGGGDMLFKAVAKLSPSIICGQEGQEEVGEGKAILEHCLMLLNSLLVDKSSTTDLSFYQSSIDLIYEHQGIFFELSRDKNLHIRHYACQLLRIVILDSVPKRSEAMQKAARDYGVLLWHIQLSVDPREDVETRARSRDLVAILCIENSDSLKVVSRTLPSALFAYLKSDSDKYWRESLVPSPSSIKSNSKEEKAILDGTARYIWLSSQPSLITSRLHDWKQLYIAIATDYENPLLIWNPSTRNELVNTLRSEVEDLSYLRQKFSGFIGWDSEGFEINYASLKSELYVGGFYLRLLTAHLQDQLNPLPPSLESLNPQNLIWDIYNHFIIETNTFYKTWCLHTIRCVCLKFPAVTDDFGPMKFYGFLLNSENCLPVWSDQILLSLKILFNSGYNAKQFVSCDGIVAVIRLLCQCVSVDLSHSLGEGGNDTSLSSDVVDGDTSIDELRRYSNSSASTDGVEPLGNWARTQLLLDVISLAVRKVSRLRYQLGDFNLLCSLANVLLHSDISVINRMSELLISVLRANPRIQTTIHKTGIFEFLLLSIESQEGMTIEVSEFFEACHRAVHDGKEEERYFHYYLPHQMIELLISDGGEAFRKVMNSETSEDAFISWDAQMRQQMLVHVHNQLADYIHTLTSDPQATYTYKEPEKIVYTALENQLCIGGVFIISFISRCSSGRGLLANIKQDRVSSFFQALCNDVFVDSSSDHQGEDDRFQSVLTCIQLVLEQRPDVSIPPPFFSTLVTLFDYIEEASQHEHGDKMNDLLYQALNICLLALASYDSGGKQYSKKAVYDTFTRQNGLHYITSVFNRCVRSILELSTACPPFQLDIIFICMEICGKVMGVNHEAFDRQTQFLHHLVLLVSSRLLSVPDLPHHALSFIESVIQHDKVASKLVDYGLIIYLLNISLLGHEYQELSVHAASILSLLGRVSKEEKVKAILVQLLTPGIMRLLLKSHGDFVKMVEDDRSIETPTVIWNHSMKEELTSVLETQMIALFLQSRSIEELEGEDEAEYEHVMKWKLEAFLSPSSYIDTFHSLKEEVIICDVFLRVANSQPGSIIDKPSPRDFMEGLLDFLCGAQKELQEEVSIEHQDDRLVQIIQTQIKWITVCSIALLNLINQWTALMPSLCASDKLESVIELLKVCEKGEYQMAVLRLLIRISEYPGGYTQIMKQVHYFHVLLLDDIMKTEDGAVDEDRACGVLQVFQNVVLVLDDNSLHLLHHTIPLSCLFILLQPSRYGMDLRISAAKLLGLLVTSTLHGDVISSYVVDITSPLFACNTGHRSSLMEAYKAPEELIDKVDHDFFEPKLIWNSSMRQDVLKSLRKELDRQRKSPAELPFDGNVRKFITKPTLSLEPCVNGIYLRYYISNPQLKVDEEFISLLVHAIDSDYLKLTGASEREREPAIERLDTSYTALKLALTEHPEYINNGELLAYTKYIFDNFNPSVPQRVQVSALNVLEVMSKSAAVASLLLKNCLHNGGGDAYILSILRLFMTFEDNTDVLKTLLHCLSNFIVRSSQLGTCVKASGGLLYILYIVLHNEMINDYLLGESSCGCINVLCTDETNGVNIRTYISNILTAEFYNKLSLPPAALMDFFFKDHFSAKDKRHWNSLTRSQLRQVLYEVVSFLDEEPVTGWDGVKDRFDGVEIEDFWLNNTEVEDGVDAPPVVHHMEDRAVPVNEALLRIEQGRKERLNIVLPTIPGRSNGTKVEESGERKEGEEGQRVIHYDTQQF